LGKYESSVKSGAKAPSFNNKPTLVGLLVNQHNIGC